MDDNDQFPWDTILEIKKKAAKVTLSIHRNMNK